jgi:carboxymethylenebutenolidase
MCDLEPVDRRSFIVQVASATAGMAVGCHGAWSGAEARRDDSPRGNPSEARADESGIQGEMVSFKSGEDLVRGYLARPKDSGRHRAILLLHGEIGVPEGPRNVAEQLAQAGYVCLAYERFGRWPELTPADVAASDRTDKRFLSGSFNDQELGDAQAAIQHLESQPFVAPGGVGAIGFCGGGYQALLLSTRSKDVRAVVVFYAPPSMPEAFRNGNDPRPSLMDKVDRIHVPIQGHYGADDPVVSLDVVNEFEQALKKNGTQVTFFVYPEATHTFFDSTRSHYNAEAAALAKARMLEFFEQRLK